MTPDDVIALRRTLRGYEYGDVLPAATILATADWLAYVTAMADAIEPGPQIEWPTEQDVRWAWPDGVLIVFAHPVVSEHVIVSHTDADTRELVTDEPHYEPQTIQAISIGAPADVRPRGPNGEIPVYPDGTLVTFVGRGTIYIGVDPSDICTGWMTFGAGRQAADNLNHVGGVSRFLLALVTALGHRLTTVSPPVGSRAERRRLERELPDLRIIDLAAGATTESRGGHVEWSHRWMVKGYWRSQPCGPGWSLRKMKWVDAYVKGPADLPLVIRPTVWRTPEL